MLSPNITARLKSKLVGVQKSIEDGLIDLKNGNLEQRDVLSLIRDLNVSVSHLHDIDGDIDLNR